MSVYVSSNSDAVKTRHRASLAESLNVIGDLIVQDIQDDLSEPFPPASSPGNPPHQRTGLLRAGVFHDGGPNDHGASETIASSRIGNSPVPVFLEFGTHNDDGSQRMAPRPFMRPAKQKWSGRLKAELAAELRSRIGK